MTSNMKDRDRERETEKDGEIAEGKIKVTSPYSQTLPSLQLYLKTFHSFVLFSELGKAHPSTLTQVTARNMLKLLFCEPSSSWVFLMCIRGFCWLRRTLSFQDLLANLSNKYI
jgi:hypothetical protein